MKRGEIIIDEKRCFGCGYCVEFCPGNCLERSLERVSPLGHAVPVFAKPQKCTTCGACARICPRWAITVNRCSEELDSVIKEEISAISLDPPLSGCPGCQH